ncbi:alpha/beta hydrolase [Leptospira langatensis]|uniref:Alpha/beta hydrolase n=1 Tax=Leptospira langatensis TaxID=2484983 RepID=A0A5F1ZYQ0_9LEPT|nr:alpha/beta hydrolase [Leptospira langatensis]TGJ98203.1 alpha/beta hydrolase [Leptospira langatensis]TGL43117.1 alpha/beta hydrolase [Leptospira langatensis]
MKLVFPMCINFNSVLLSLLLLFSVYCGGMLYHPTRETYIEPEKLGFQPERFFLKMKDGTLVRVWIFKPKGQAKASILQFHGNGENMSSHYITLVWMVERGYELITWDYRGYGESEGEADKEEIHQDSKEILDFAQERARKVGIPWIVYGQSLGGAIALRGVGEMKNKDGLLLVVADGSFAYYSHVAKTIADRVFFAPVGSIVSLFFSDHLSPGDTIDQISPTRLLLVHGTEDDVVSFPNGMELFEKAKDPKLFWEIKGAKHLDWMQMGRSKGAGNFLKYVDQLTSQNPKFQ